MTDKNLETATLAAGCFWCVEAVFDDQRKTAEEIIAEITAERIYDNPIVTEVAPFDKFWPAEDYHQEYFANNPAQPYCAAVVAPKVAKFRQKFVSRLKG